MTATPGHGAGAGRVGVSRRHGRHRGPRRPPGQGQARHPEGGGGRSWCGSRREPGGELHAIVGIEPRRTVLERRVPEGRGVRPIAANIDQVFVVVATRSPDPIPQLIDRLLVLADADGIAAAVVLNKVDLDPGTEIAERCRRSGYLVHLTSVKTGEGIESLRARDGRQGIGGHRPVRRRQVQPAERHPTRAPAPHRRDQPPDPAGAEHHGLVGDASAGRRRVPGGYAGVQRGGDVGGGPSGAGRLLP